MKRLPRAPFALLSAAVAAVVWLAPAPAAAQSEADLERARVAFQQGDLAEQGGDCKTAIGKFTEALEVKETAQLHLRIGRCQEKLGQFQAASSSYAKGQSLAGGDEALLGLARKMRAGLEPRIPRLIVRMPDAPPGATVTLDGLTFSSFGVDTPLDPGAHVVRAEAPGRSPFEAKVDLKEAERREVLIALPTGALTTTPEEADGDGPAAAPIVMFVLGAGFLGASIGLAVRGNDLLGEADAEAAAQGCRLVPEDEQDAAGAVRTCSGSPAAHEQYVDAISEVNLNYGLAAGFGAAAGVSVIVGAVLLGLDLSAGPEDEKAAPAVSFSPWFGPNGAGTAVSGRF